MHGNLVPLGSAFVTRVETHGVSLQANDLRCDDLVGISTHGYIARSHLDVIKRSGATARRCAPKQCCAMPQISRPGQNHPDQHAQRSGANADESYQGAIGYEAGGLRGARNIKGVSGQKLDKWFADSSVTFSEGHQAL